MSEEARPMTPTEEEAELYGLLSILEGDTGEAIRAILAAGYVKRNDALEEAALLCDVAHDDYDRLDFESAGDGAAYAASTAYELSRAIRALKAKTQGE